MESAPITLMRLDRSHHAVVDELRAHGPVVWVEALGAWMVLDREHSLAVLRDAKRFTVDDPRFSTAQVVGTSMISLDGAAQRHHRDPFVSAFRPSVVMGRLGPRIAAEAVGLVERLRTAGRGDLAAAVAAPLAAGTAAMALGLDSVRSVTLLGWYRRIVAATEQQSLASSMPHRADEEVMASAARAMDALRSALTDAASDHDGPLAPVASALTEDELVSNAAVFLFGAIETTEGMIANLFRHLLADDRLLAAVRDDRSLVVGIIEESLRLEPAVARVDRYATRDTTLAGARIAAGDFVVVSLAGANRDPAVHRRPHEFRLDRAGEPGHLSFVHGPHACIGAQLARIEARAATDAVLDRLPGLEADPDAGATDTDVAGIVFRKPRSVPARWMLQP
jgi:cytochrome P450